MFSGVSMGIDAKAVQAAEDVPQTFDLPLTNQDVAMEELIAALIISVIDDKGNQQNTRNALDELTQKDYTTLREHAEKVKSAYEQSGEEQKKS